MSQRSREWVFTVNNHSADDRERIGANAIGFCTYLCYQPELAPTTGTPHLQGYLCLTTPRTLRGVKQVLFDTERLRAVHLEIARGTKEQCREYCRKPDSFDGGAGFPFFECGRYEDVPERRGQGARNDIAQAAAAIQRGECMAQVAETTPEAYVRYYRGFAALQSALHAKPRVRDATGAYAAPRVCWYYGSAGSGKTRAVYDEIGEEPFFMKAPGNSWFDGYIGQKILLLDDFRSNWFTFGYLLRLLDRYPLDVEVKGGYVHFSATTIYITCPRKPQDLYSDLEARSEGSMAQLIRRITEVRLFGDEPPPVAPAVVGFFPN